MDSFIGIYYPAQEFVAGFHLAIDEEQQAKAILDAGDPEFWRLVSGVNLVTVDPLLCCQQGFIAHAIRNMDGPVIDNLMSAIAGLSGHRFQWLNVRELSDGHLDVQCHPIRATTLRQAVKMFEGDPRISLAYSGKFPMLVKAFAPTRMLKVGAAAYHPEGPSPEHA